MSKSTTKQNYVTSHSGASYTNYGAPVRQAAVILNGATLWGGSAGKMRDFFFKDGDVIINCSSSSISSQLKDNFLLAPDWISDLVSEFNSVNVEEIHLNVPDFTAPRIKPEFWFKLMERFIERKVQRIFVCCGAGIGRTGTVLASLLVTIEGVSPVDAIGLLREHYHEDAVERDEQVAYVCSVAGEDYEELLDSYEDENEIPDELFGSDTFRKLAAPAASTNYGSNYGYQPPPPSTQTKTETPVKTTALAKVDKSWAWDEDEDWDNFKCSSLDPDFDKVNKALAAAKVAR